MRSWRSVFSMVAIAIVAGLVWSGAAVAQSEVKITASDAAVFDLFGYSVSISGDYAIVGAPSDNDPLYNSGSAYIFYRSGTNWSQQAKLTASDDVFSNFFGHSVSISGDYVIVGSLGGNANSGFAYIFSRSGTNWSQQAKLVADDAVAGDQDQFGHSVAIDGEYAVVGAPGNDSAYIFTRSGGATWNQVAKLTGDGFGSSVAIDGEYAFLGNVIFSRSGTTWSQQAKLGTYGPVSISGDYAISGSAYIFYRSGTTWSQQAHLVASDAAEILYWGGAVSIYDNIAIVGAEHTINSDDGLFSGSAYIFSRSGTTWSQQEKLTASDAAASDHFGNSVSISNDYAIVGSFGDNNRRGSAYIIHLGPSPILDIAAQIEFGDVLVGSSVTDSAKIKNTGTADMSVSTVAVTGVDTPSFVATPLSLSVPAGDSAYVQITFTPGSLGAKSAALELTHNAEGSPTSISLSGTGVFPDIVAATSLPLGDVLVGSSATDSAKVKNTGTATLSVSEMTVTGADSALFTAAPETLSVSAGDSAWVKVTFTPPSVGAKTATLQLAHNASGSPTAITLTGTGGQSVTDIADTLSFTSDDGSNTKVKFESGTITGVSVSHENHGRELPSGISSDSAPTIPVLYFEINTTLPDTATFTATVSIKYTQAMLDSANVTDETTLKLFRFDAGGGIWTQLVTVVDTSANTATATTSSFSVWGLGSATPTGIEMENEAKALPNSFALHHARPNPFNPSTTIAYEVPEQTHNTLTIYNLLGQKVIRLMDQVQAAGRYEAVWHGVNSRGTGVASGIYLYRIVSGSGYKDTKRMTLLK